MIQDNLQFKTLFGTIIALILITLSAPSFAQEGGLIFIFEVKGNVQFKSSKSQNYQKVYGGELLSSFDKLRLEKGASVKIRCDNLQISNIDSPGEFDIAKGCSSSSRVILTRPNAMTRRASGSR
ncbi:MAG TPA: hypothetical protein VK184_25215 [Nostocaceae cyanobacterium]|nr:hypothetical protein [Nostocaceae cyanobacterium]